MENIPLHIPPRIVTPESPNKALRTGASVTISCPVLVDGDLWGHLHVNFLPGPMDWRLSPDMPPVRLGRVSEDDLPGALAAAAREARKRLESRIRRPLRDAVWVVVPGRDAPKRAAGRKESAADSAALHPYVDQALHFAEEHADRPITISQVAGYVNVSDQYFCRIFRESTGISFMQHLAALRVNRARRLLAESSGSVKEIAFLVGFGSIAQFNRVFKKHCGKSPSDYRAACDRSGKRDGEPLLTMAG